MTTTDYQVEHLWVDSVGVKPVAIDWSAALDESEGWRAYEAPECECGEHATWNANEHEWQCANEDCERCGSEVEDDYSDGPMMNYYYPIPDLRRVGGPHEAASLISDLPLCVVEFENSDEYALALTGGGMDLSWEICAAYTRLGFLPPIHFCDLPAMAGYEKRTYTIAACLRSCEVAESQAQRTRERLLALRKDTA